MITFLIANYHDDFVYDDIVMRNSITQKGG